VTTNTAAQVPFAKKAAAKKETTAKKPAGLLPELIAANERYRAKAALAADQPTRDEHESKRVHAARAPPRLIPKAEVLAITRVSYPTIWAWMRERRLPRSRIVGGKSMWLSSEIEAWLEHLPVRPLKGDQPETA
jgi:predicted DNA-binding transcriptional regulator AlpA